MTKRVVTFGELMLRLSPPGNLRLVQTDSFDMYFGGSEANVAVSLANYGLESDYVTKLPCNSLGDAALNHLRRYGVNTTDVLREGDRLGIYFAENGFSYRNSVVVYDRANSAFSKLKPGRIPWRLVFKDKDWFHFSGITPALGEGPAAATLEAIIVAKEMGLTVSCDLNYRKKLWAPEKAKSVMEPLLEYVDILSGLGKDEAEVIFDYKLSDPSDLSLCQGLMEKYPFKYIVNTIRQSHSVNNHSLSGMLFDGKKLYYGPNYNVNIVDRIGGGDAFISALIFALAKGFPSQQSIDFAVAAFCLKHTIPGDINHATLNEVLALAEGNRSFRVQR